MWDKERFMKIVDQYGLTKAVLLVILTFQTSCNTILVKYSTKPDRTPYHKTVLVLWMEIFKFAICTLIVLFQARSVRKFVHVLHRDIFTQPLNCLKVSVPAFLYVVQNNLLLWANQRLDVATYQVTSQLKIITTAFFCVVMLRKRLRVEQWIAIIILTLGISVVGVTQSKGRGKSAIGGHPSANFGAYISGLVLLIIASVISGFAGVYFEKILKGSGFSLWILNIQLGFFGAIAASIGILCQDLNHIKTDGFFNGFDYIVWLLALYQGVGGLVIALVIKYADNILKGFANSCSIIFSALLGAYIFGTSLSYCLMLGALLVVISVIMYGVFSK